MSLVKSNKIGSYIVIAISLMLAFLVWNNHLFAGTAPTNIGINSGQFAACPATPNCVSSQEPVSDTVHFVQPIAISKDSAAHMADLKVVITSMPRSTIITATNNYLYAEFTSQLMGFVDDVEFYFDGNGKSIQVRSASRLGESDLGVNRQRIEQIRSQVSSLN